VYCIEAERLSTVKLSFADAEVWYVSLKLVIDNVTKLLGRCVFQRHSVSISFQTTSYHIAAKIHVDLYRSLSRSWVFYLSIIGIGYTRILLDFCRAEIDVCSLKQPSYLRFKRYDRPATRIDLYSFQFQHSKVFLDFAQYIWIR
jgi:hypothetical protein